MKTDVFLFGGTGVQFLIDPSNHEPCFMIAGSTLQQPGCIKLVYWADTSGPGNLQVRMGGVWFFYTSFLQTYGVG